MIRILINNNYLLICILSFIFLNHKCNNFSIILNLNSIFSSNTQECIICFIKRKCIDFFKSLILFIFCVFLIFFGGFLYFTIMCFSINHFLYDNI